MKSTSKSKSKVVKGKAQRSPRNTKSSKAKKSVRGGASSNSESVSPLRKEPKKVKKNEFKKESVQQRDESPHLDISSDSSGRLNLNETLDEKLQKLNTSVKKEKAESKNTLSLANAKNLLEDSDVTGSRFTDQSVAGDMDALAANMGLAEDPKVRDAQKQRVDEEERVKQQALDRIREKMFYQTNIASSGTPTADLDQRQHFFEQLPKRLRIMLKDDVIQSLYKEQNDRISKVPEKWLMHLDYGKNKEASKSGLKYDLNDIDKQIKADLKAMVHHDLDNGDMSDSDLPDIPGKKYDNLEELRPLRIDLFTQQNKLSQLIQRTSKDGQGFPCYMWWPQMKVFTPVKSIGIYEQNAKFLQVIYYKPKPLKVQKMVRDDINFRLARRTAQAEQPQDYNDEKRREEFKGKYGRLLEHMKNDQKLKRQKSRCGGKDDDDQDAVDPDEYFYVDRVEKAEYYNLLELHMESLKAEKSNKKLTGEGITHMMTASNYLKNQTTVKDIRVGKRNVLKLTHSALEFERIFVFYEDRKLIENLQAELDVAAEEEKQKKEEAKRNNRNVYQLTSYRDDEDGKQPSDHELQHQKNKKELETVCTMPIKITRTGCLTDEALKQGEQSLQDFVDGVNLLLSKIYEHQNEFQGRVVAVRDLRRPMSPSAFRKNDLTHKTPEQGQLGNEQQTSFVNLNNMSLMEVYDADLENKRDQAAMALQLLEDTFKEKQDAAALMAPQSHHLEATHSHSRANNNHHERLNTWKMRNNIFTSLAREIGDQMSTDRGINGKVECGAILNDSMNAHGKKLAQYFQNDRGQLEEEDALLFMKMLMKKPTVLFEFNNRLMKGESAQDIANSLMRPDIVRDMIVKTFEEDVINANSHDDFFTLSLRFNGFADKKSNQTFAQQASYALDINFVPMRKVRDEQVLGITMNEPEAYVQGTDIVKEEEKKFNSDLCFNLRDYWYEFDDQLKQVVDFSLKGMDYMLIKQYLCERILPEYSKICLEQVIRKILEGVYLEKLQANATNKFMQWVKKQLEGSQNKPSKLMEDINKKQSELIIIDSELSMLHNLLNDCNAGINLQFSKYQPHKLQAMDLDPGLFKDGNKRKSKLGSVDSKSMGYIIRSRLKKLQESLSWSNDLQKSGGNLQKARSNSLFDFNTNGKDKKEDNVTQKSPIEFLRARPDVLFFENMTLKRQASLDKQRIQKLGSIQANLIEVGMEELKRRRKELIKLIQAKQLETVKINSELSDLQMKLRILQKVAEGQINEYMNFQNQKIGHSDNFLEAEAFKPFNLLPLQYLNLTTQKRIELFRSQAKEKVLNLPKFVQNNLLGQCGKRTQKLNSKYDNLLRNINHTLAAADEVTDYSSAMEATGRIKQQHELQVPKKSKQIGGQLGQLKIAKNLSVMPGQRKQTAGLGIKSQNSLTGLSMTKNKSQTVSIKPKNKLQMTPQGLNQDIDKLHHEVERQIESRLYSLSNEKHHRGHDEQSPQPVNLMTKMIAGELTKAQLQSTGRLTQKSNKGQGRARQGLLATFRSGALGRLKNVADDMADGLESQLELMSRIDSKFERKAALQDKCASDSEQEMQRNKHAIAKLEKTIQTLFQPGDDPLLNSQKRRADAQEHFANEFPSLQSHPLTQAYDTLAAQELELRLKLHDYDNQIQHATGKVRTGPIVDEDEKEIIQQDLKMKRRRGGKKNQKAKLKKAQKEEEHHSRVTPDLNMSSVTLKEALQVKQMMKLQMIAKENNASVEQVRETQDLLFHSEDFEYCDAYGHPMLPSQFTAVLNGYKKYFQKKLGHHPKSNKPFKKGARENWDKEYREEAILKRKKEAVERHEEYHQIRHEMQARMQAKNSSVRVTLEMQRDKSEAKAFAMEYCGDTSEDSSEEEPFEKFVNDANIEMQYQKGKGARIKPAQLSNKELLKIKLAETNRQHANSYIGADKKQDVLMNIHSGNNYEDSDNEGAALNDHNEHKNNNEKIAKQNMQMKDKKKRLNFIKEMQKNAKEKMERLRSSKMSGMNANLSAFLGDDDSQEIDKKITSSARAREEKMIALNKQFQEIYGRAKAQETPDDSDLSLEEDRLAKRRSRGSVPIAAEGQTPFGKQRSVSKEMKKRAEQPGCQNCHLF